MNHEQNVRPAKGAGKITNVRYYTEDGTQVQEAVSTLERMSPEMAVYIIRMAAASVFPALEKSRGQEIVSTFEMETAHGKELFIQISL